MIGKAFKNVLKLSSRGIAQPWKNMDNYYNDKFTNKMEFIGHMKEVFRFQLLKMTNMVLVEQP